MKQRLDRWLVEKGHAPTRSKAQALIEAGQVLLIHNQERRPLTKASFEVEDHFQIEVSVGEADRFVSRAGLKLEKALEHLQLNVQGFRCLDVGQSTGGFTDCLLQRGVKQVIGFDVGHDQLAAKLRTDSRVLAFEGINARDLGQATDLLQAVGPQGIDLIVMDVSFISQSLILPELSRFTKMGTGLLSLVKPQFEVGPEGLGKGGIVRDPLLSEEARRKINRLARELGWHIQAEFESSVPGKDGNKEYFIYGIKETL